MIFRQYQQQQLAMLRKQYDALIQNEARLRTARAYENDVAHAMKLDYQINEIIRQRVDLERQIQELERRLAQQPGLAGTPVSQSQINSTYYTGNPGNISNAGIPSNAGNIREPGSASRSGSRGNTGKRFSWRTILVCFVVVVLVGGGIYAVMNHFAGSNGPTSFPVNFPCTNCTYAGLGVTLNGVAFDTAHSSTTLNFTINNTGSQGCSGISFNTVYLQDIEGTQYKPQETNQFSVAPGHSIDDSEIIPGFIPASGAPYILNLSINVYNCSQQGNNTYQTQTITFQSPNTAKGPNVNTLTLNQQLVCATCNYNGLGVTLDSVIVDASSNKTILHFSIHDTGVMACSGISFANIQLKDSGGNKFTPSQSNTFSVAPSYTIDDYEVIDNLTPASGTKYSLLSPQIYVDGCSQQGSNTYQDVDIMF